MAEAEQAPPTNNDGPATQEETPADAAGSTTTGNARKSLPEEATAAGGSEPAKTSPKNYDRNVMLLTKLLDLEAPVITDRMVDFLLQEGVCEILMGFVTQVSEENFTGRPVHGCEVTDELKRSYRTIRLFGEEEPSAAWTKFMDAKAEAIAGAIFDIFHPKSCGSLYHACSVIKSMLQRSTDKVLDTIGSSVESVEKYLGVMLANISQPPVYETFLSIIGCGEASHPAKHRFYTSLSQWKLLLRVCDNITDPRGSSAHISACADAFLELTAHFAADPNGGEMMVQPIAHCPDLLSSLVTTVVGPSDHTQALCRYGQRYDAARVLETLLSQSMSPEVVVGPKQDAALAALHGIPVEKVKNQLLQVSSKLMEVLIEALPDLAKVLAGTPKGWDLVTNTSYSKIPEVPPVDGFGIDDDLPVPPGDPAAAAVPPPPGSGGGGASGGCPGQGGVAIRHTGHYAAPPLTALRVSVVALMANMVDQETANIDLLSPELWRVLAALFFQYPHSDLFHFQFYRLFFIVLRENHEVTLRNLLQKNRFLANLIDRAGPGTDDHGAAGSEGHNGRGAADSSAADVMALGRGPGGGTILRICNAIRLQVATLAPSSFLRQFLQSHERWRKFAPSLVATTVAQQQRGMGIPIAADRELGYSRDSLDGFPDLGDDPFGDSTPDSDNFGPDQVGHGSDFARVMGFDGEAEWVEEAPAAKKKGKRNKKKKKKKGGGGALAAATADGNGSGAANDGGDDVHRGGLVNGNDAEELEGGDEMPRMLGDDSPDPDVEMPSLDELE